MVGNVKNTGTCSKTPHTHTNHSSTKCSRAAGIIHLFLSGSGDLPWGFEVQLVDVR